MYLHVPYVCTHMYVLGHSYHLPRSAGQFVPGLQPGGIEQMGFCSLSAETLTLGQTRESLETLATRGSFQSPRTTGLTPAMSSLHLSEAGSPLQPRVLMSTLLPKLRHGFFVRTEGMKGSV